MKNSLETITSIVRERACGKDVKKVEALLTVKFRAQELCESGSGRPGLPVVNSPYGLCGRKTTLNFTVKPLRERQTDRDIDRDRDRGTDRDRERQRERERAL